MCFAQGHSTETLVRLEPAAQMPMLTYPVGLGLSQVNSYSQLNSDSNLVCFIF